MRQYQATLQENPRCIFSIDVEDWFHILDLPSTPPLSEWGLLPSRVEKNFFHLLEIISEADVRITCFFLGWVAEKFPHLVREAQARGHEIASHGYSHQLVYRMTPGQFLDDALKAKKILEDVSGSEVTGYRSSGFSVTKDTPWFFETLAAAGYRYDSSVFPAVRGHGGIATKQYAPYRVSDGPNGLIEFPISVARVFGRPVCFFGGGYLRLFPYLLVKRMTQRVIHEGRPVVFYVHPREIDPSHPRLPMRLLRRFKSYVNLTTTETKIRRLLSEFSFTTFEDAVGEFRSRAENRDHVKKQDCQVL
jgi:polysaccharide deacetylase family protein (PEP-CTERM system associated)